MDSRIAALDLRLRTAAGDGEAIATAATGFARRVLTRCDEVLESRHPGRLFFLRQVDTAWRVLAEQLDRDGEVDAVATALADGIEEEVDARARDGSRVETFASEADYRAAYLCAVAANRADHWCFQRLRDEGPAPGVLADGLSRTLAIDVCVRLAERNALAIALNLLAGDRLDALAAAIGAATLVPVPDDGGEDDQRLASRVASGMGSPARDSLTRIACLIEARRDRGHTASESETRAAAARAYGRIRRDAHEDATGAPLMPAQPVAPTGQPLRHPPPGDGTPSITTRFGGVFYCLGPALELSLGDIAWTACLSDSAFLARIARMLIGPSAEDDPAPRVFGGSRGDPQIGPIDEDRRQEMAEAMLRALVDALPRRNLAGLPQIEWQVVHLRSERFLLAAPLAMEYPLFAWPAASSGSIEAGLRTFNRIWPRGTPGQVAHPAVAAADPTGRVQAHVQTALARRLLLAEADNVHEAAVVTQAGGALAYLFAARLGTEGAGVAAVLRSRFLSIPARVDQSDGELTMTLPSDRIDLAVRRAGLDRNPGWVPWLRASVRIVFDQMPDGAMD